MKRYSVYIKLDAFSEFIPSLKTFGLHQTLQSANTKFSLFEYIPLKLDFYLTPIEQIVGGYADINYKIAGSHQFRIGNLQSANNFALS